MPGRVVRCATIVGAGPHDADDLDVFDGMSAEERAEWECALQGEKCLTGQFFRDLKAWVETLPDRRDFPEGDRLMLSEAFREGLLTADGLVDDYASLLQPWGVDLARVECPVKVMIARDDRGVPPAHGHWLVKHVPNAEAVLVDGGHFGPRDEPEERLLNWLANGSLHPAAAT